MISMSIAAAQRHNNLLSWSLGPEHEIKDTIKNNASPDRLKNSLINHKQRQTMFAEHEQYGCCMRNLCTFRSKRRKKNAHKSECVVIAVNTSRYWKCIDAIKCRLDWKCRTRSYFVFVHRFSALATMWIDTIAAGYVWMVWMNGLVYPCVS